MASLTVTHEPASQRRHFRVTAPAAVNLGGARYPTVDWSLGGFKVSGYNGGVQPGERQSVEFLLDFQGFQISFPALAEVLRREGDQLAARFLTLGERESNLMRQFVSGVTSGQVAPVDGVLKHLDRPVTKVALVQTAESPAAASRRNWRRLAVSAVYIIFGLALTALAGYTLAQLWTVVKVETAVTAMQLEQVVSIDAGAIRELTVQPGSQVKAGQMLMRVESEVASRNVDLAKQELQSAQADLGEAHKLVEQERNRMTAYKTIGGDQTEIQKAKVKALVATRDEAQVEFERVKKLWEYGVIAKQVFDAQEATVKKHQAEVEAAQAEQRIIASSNGSIADGFFFSGNFLVGDLQARMAQEEAARDRLKVAERAVQDAQQHESKHDYKAPFDGVVLRAFKSSGMTVDRGEAVLVLRRVGEEPHVDAYLTQEEAGGVGTGVNAEAFVPAQGKHYRMQVAMVDRTSGFLKEIQTPKLQQPAFGWRNVQDRSALVRLTFVGVGGEELMAMQPGLPVEVKIPRRRDSWFGLPSVHAASKDESFTPKLWPASSPLAGKGAAKALPGTLLTRVIGAADRAERMSPAPVRTLHSAGVSDQSSPEFIASRRAFQDADNFVLLALGYRLTGKPAYMTSAKEIVNAWAAVNRPTGQPIDETRLEGFLWGLDLLGEASQTPAVREWLERWSAANRDYSFGPKTESNNHKTHHLKIQLLLDQLLGRSAEYERDRAAALAHEKVNLGAADGASLDYRERDAMHYHVFDLEPWVEIALVTGCCRTGVDRAFGFFERQVKQDPGHIEFANSTASIDGKRAAGGFSYAQAKPYEYAKAARMIFSYSTLPGSQVSQAVLDIAAEGSTHANLFHEARYYLWRARS